VKRTKILELATFMVCLSSALQAQSRPRITQPIDNLVVRIPFSVHPLAHAANDRGRVDANLDMQRMLLVLKPSEEQRAALLKLVDGQHDPESPTYHQWLTPEGFGAKFGPADEDVAKVTRWLQQRGFRVNEVGRGKQFIEFSGNAGQVESAFHTEMHQYAVNGKEHVANALDISLPMGLTPVVEGVLSLHNFPKVAAHRKSFRVRRDPDTGKLVSDFTLSNANGSAHFMAPGDFARIYNTEPLLTQKIDGAGVSIAIVARSNINLSDVQTFRKIFGLPAKDPLFIVNGQDPGIGPDEEEADLDVEWSGAAAPDATIKVVMSSSTFSADGVDLSMVYIIDNVVAPIMSTSFSACELALGPTGNAFFNNLYQQAAAEGITAFVSTGDDGPAACTPQVAIEPSTLANVSGLASTPFDIAVGGTQFAEKGLDGNYWSANNRPDQSSAIGYIPEKVWNESCDPRTDPHQCSGTGLFFAVAGSGGPSSCLTSTIVNNQFVCLGGYPKPSWQAGRGVPNDGARDLPDLSLDAGASHDGFLLCVDGSCQTVESNGQTILENAAVIGGTVRRERRWTPAGATPARELVRSTR
jgi:large repetitive protein